MSVVDIAKRIQAVGESTGRFNKYKTSIRKVRCQGCRKDICSDDDLKSVEYVKTRRGTELFFHKSCADKVWKHGIV